MKATIKNFIYSILQFDYNSTTEKGEPLPRSVYPTAWAREILSLKKTLENDGKCIQEGKFVEKDKVQPDKEFFIIFVDGDIEITEQQKAAVKYLYDKLEFIPATDLEVLDYITSL